MLDIRILFLKSSSGKSRDIYCRVGQGSLMIWLPGLVTLVVSSQCWTGSSLVGTGWRTCFAFFSSVKGIRIMVRDEYCLKLWFLVSAKTILLRVPGLDFSEPSLSSCPHEDTSASQHFSAKVFKFKWVCRHENPLKVLHCYSIVTTLYQCGFHCCMEVAVGCNMLLAE